MKPIWTDEDAALAREYGFELRPSGVTCVVGRSKGSDLADDEDAQSWVLTAAHYPAIPASELCQKAVTMCMQER